MYSQFMNILFTYLYIYIYIYLYILFVLSRPCCLLYFLIISLVCNISDAQTLNWSTTQTISSGSQSGYGRPRVVTTANNSPLIMWTKTSTPKSVRVSKWNGTSFSIPYDIVYPVLEVTGFIGPEIASKGDTVYVIFLSALSANNFVYFM